MARDFFDSLLRMLFSRIIDDIEQADTVEHVYRHIPAAAVTADDKTVRELEHDPDVLYVEDNLPVAAADSTALKAFSSSTAQNASAFSQWNIKLIQAALAWNKGLTGKQVKIAVIDSGISPHEELSIAGGASMVGYTASYRDDNGHGTHVAGIIGAKAVNPSPLASMIDGSPVPSYKNCVREKTFSLQNQN